MKSRKVIPYFIILFFYIMCFILLINTFDSKYFPEFVQKIKIEKEKSNQQAEAILKQVHKK